MTIKVKCNVCQVKLAVRDKAAGKTIKCPKCFGPIEVPVMISGPISRTRRVRPEELDSPARHRPRPTPQVRKQESLARFDDPDILIIEAEEDESETASESSSPASAPSTTTPQTPSSSSARVESEAESPTPADALESLPEDEPPPAAEEESSDVPMIEESASDEVLRSVAHEESSEVIETEEAQTSTPLETPTASPQSQVKLQTPAAEPVPESVPVEIDELKEDELAPAELTSTAIESSSSLQATTQAEATPAAKRSGMNPSKSAASSQNVASYWEYTGNSSSTSETGTNWDADPPWEDRMSVRSYFGTVYAVLRHPLITFGNLPTTDDWRPAWFLLIGNFLHSLALVGLFCLVAATSPNLLPEFVARLLDVSVFLLGMTSVLCFVGLFIVQIIGAWLLHWGLRVTGPLGAEFDSTLRVVCYANGAWAFVASLPVVGTALWLLLGAVVWPLPIVTMLLGLSKAHGISFLRSVIGLSIALIFAVVLGGVLFGLYALFAFFG